MRANTLALIVFLVGWLGSPAQGWAKGHHGGGGHGHHVGHGVAAPTPTCRDHTCVKTPSPTSAPGSEAGDVVDARIREHDGYGWASAKSKR